MAQTFNDNVQLNAPKPLDNKYARFVGGATVAYASVADVNSTILPEYRHRGLTVLIETAGVFEEYWYRNGIDDLDLILKTNDAVPAPPGTEVYKGSVLSGPALANATFLIPTDIDGLLYEVPAGPTIDNIQYFSKDSKTWKRVTTSSSVRASDAGIFPNGSDQTSRINTVINSSLVTVLIFDLDSTTVINYTVNGTITIPAGKTIRFAGNTRFIGTYTINGGTIDAPYEQWIFGGTPTARFNDSASRKVSAKWWGAKGDGVTDDTVNLQRACDYIVYSTGCHHLFIPRGKYIISKGLLLWKDSNANGDPEFIRFIIEGEMRTYTGELFETLIWCTHADNFAIGIMRGKGCYVGKIYFRGPNQLTYSTIQAHNGTSTFIASGVPVRTNQYSPFTAVCIDPIGREAGYVIAAGDRYPGFESLYGVPGNGGSTDIEFEDIIFDGFYVAWICSPNGNTQNNESHLINKYWIRNCKYGIVTCNSQEREIICRDGKIWDSVHTCFSTHGFGYSRGDAPIIQGLNVAGTVFQIFHYTSFFLNASIMSVHAESFRRIGYLYGSAVIKDSHFNFAFDNSNLRYPAWLCAGYNITFENCNLFFYQGEIAVPFNFAIHEGLAMLLFKNCVIPNPVRIGQWGNWTTDGHAIIYENCKTYLWGGKIWRRHIMGLVFNYTPYLTAGSYLEFALHGKEITQHNYSQREYFSQTRKIISPGVAMYRIFGGVVVTVTDLGATFSIPTLAGKNAAYANKVVFGRFLNIVTDAGAMNMLAIGRIVSVDAGGAVVMDNIIEGLVSGTYTLEIEHPCYLDRPTIGNLNGTTVTNAYKEGSLTAHEFTNQSVTQVMNFVVDIMTVGANTFTISEPLYNGDRMIFCNYLYDESGWCWGNPAAAAQVENGVIFTKGAKYRNTDPSKPGEIEYLCTKSGMKGNATIPPEFKTIYANPFIKKTVVNVNTTIAIPAKVKIESIYIKSSHAITVNITSDEGLTLEPSNPLTVNVLEVIMIDYYSENAQILSITGIAGTGATVEISLNVE